MRRTEPTSGPSTPATGDRLRLLFAVPFAPRFDHRHGGRVVAQLICHLAEHHDVGVVYLAAGEPREIDDRVRSCCQLVERVAGRSSPAIRAGWRHRLDVLSGPLARRPASVVPARSRQLERTLHDVARRWQPEVIQLENDTLAYCVPRLVGLPAAKVLVCHEPGYTASLELLRANHGRQRLAHKLDSWTWRRYWRRTLPLLDALVAFTDSDARALREVIEAPPVTTIPLGTELPPTPLSPTGAAEPSVVFVGGYAHQPNADAALRLMSSIMPLVRRRLPELKLVLVGHAPPPAMVQAAGVLDAVTGTVERVEPYIDDAAVVALPIRLGGGMRVKLLEALAAGKAVVASPLAAAGLNLEPGQQLLMAGSDEEFADAICDLVEDAEARAALGRRARLWAEEHLDWSTRARSYEQLYRRLLADRASAVAPLPAVSSS